jgi:phage major head subunit gpT-like protein
MLTSGIALLLKTAQQSFWNTYYAIPDPFSGLVYMRQSTQKTDTYAWLGGAPMPEEWAGDGNVKVANEYSYTGKNKAWKSGVRIDKELIKFQQWDEIARLTGNLGEKARAHKTKKLSDLLNAGVTTLGPDGQLFFDTDHAWSGAEYTTSQDNDLTGTAATGATPTDLEMATAIRAQFDKLFSYKDDRGDPMYPPSDDPANFIVMVPPDYRSIAMRVLKADALTGPVGNDLQGTFTVRVNPFLTAPGATGAFYMLYAGSGHKPLVIQEAGALDFGNNLEGDEFRSSGNAVFDASWWGETIYGQWATAVSYIFT